MLTETQKTKAAEAFTSLLEVVHELREKCPWDKEQTFESLRPLTIEELYELTDAILDKDYDEIKKELGDVLLHLLFYARIAEEDKKFDIVSVCNSLREKLIIRHPHIYGEINVENSDEVKRNWEQIKLKQGNKGTLSGVPKSLPSLVKASRLQDKASAVGFDWEQTEDVWKKVQEELAELHEEVENNSTKEAIEAEFGDLFFSLVNYARFLDINPDNALERTNQKFLKRFNFLESEVSKTGKKLKDMSLEEMDVYWNLAKKDETKI